MNRYFTSRESCPACRAESSTLLFEAGYEESPIKDYLDGFYPPQGKVEHEYLKGSRYILDQCGECGLIYQRQIPGDFLAAKIYEEWIDPETVTTRYTWAPHPFNYRDTSASSSTASTTISTKRTIPISSAMRN